MPDPLVRRVFPAEVPAVLDDLAAVLVDAVASGMALGFLAPFTLDDARRAWHAMRSQLGDDHVLFGALEGRRLVGTAQLVVSEAANSRHRAEVAKVAVAAEDRGQGIGSRLMEAVEAYAVARDVTLLWLTTHADTPAARFYERRGYVLLGEMPDYSRQSDGTLWPGAFYYRALER